MDEQFMGIMKKNTAKQETKARNLELEPEVDTTQTLKPLLLLIVKYLSGNVEILLLLTFRKQKVQC